MVFITATESSRTQDVRQIILAQKRATGWVCWLVLFLPTPERLKQEGCREFLPAGKQPGLQSKALSLWRNPPNKSGWTVGGAH